MDADWADKVFPLPRHWIVSVLIVALLQPFAAVAMADHPSTPVDADGATDPSGLGGHGDAADECAEILHAVPIDTEIYGTVNFAADPVDYYLVDPSGYDEETIVRAIVNAHSPVSAEFELVISVFSTEDCAVNAVEGEPGAPAPSGPTTTTASPGTVSFTPPSLALQTASTSGLHLGNDKDGDGHRIKDGDCDDTDPTVYPGAPELADGQDNDCDGLVDEGASSGTDADGDGHTVEAGDCDDADPTSYPGATELDDGKDNDCDGLVDEGVRTDNDGDGHAVQEGDCDDGDASVYPGADEVFDGKDNDCDGLVDDADPTCVDCDLDGDGVADTTDNCPDDANPRQSDVDGDGVGSSCETQDARRVNLEEVETTVGNAVVLRIEVRLKAGTTASTPMPNTVPAPDVPDLFQPQPANCHNCFLGYLVKLPLA